MICPVCKKAMIVVEQHQIELDYCTRCRGVWFDAGELELLLASEKLEGSDLGIKNILSLPEVLSSRPRRKCPICGRSMKEVAIGQPAINIDACRRGDGLWFDGGEVQELLRQLAGQSAGAGSEQRIITFLGEVFQVSE
jgi:Zn-finger nucleic acid-binding protein